MYPIYNTHASWNQDDYQNNSTGFDTMYREDPGLDAMQGFAEKWWADYAARKLAGKNPVLLSLEVTRKPDEDWCLTWFSHYTFDTGQTDAEILVSFASYVNRTEDYNAGHMIWYEAEGGGFWSEPICLMGAEDKWRWKGPCRCEHCQKRGVISIDH